jgi:RNA polymerase sigma-32 factor
MRDQAMETPILERERELMLARAWKESADMKSRDELVNAHRKLVMGMARRFERGGVQLADLMNEGMLALMVACDKFNPDSGYRFATYAQWWVLTFLQEAVQRDASPVRIGKTRMEKAVFRALTRARRRFGPDLGDDVKEVIAASFGIRFDEVSNIDAATGLRTLSLNQTVTGDEDGIEFIDTLVDETQGVEKAMESTLTRAQIREIGEVMVGLGARETTVIRERFLSDDPKTLRELAEQLDISAERVRQIERETLSNLRRLLEDRGLRKEDIIADVG